MAIQDYNGKTYTQLLNDLRNPDLDINDWATIIHRLHRDNTASNVNGTGNHSFFAQQVNSFRNYRNNAEIASQWVVSAVAATTIFLPAITLAASAIIGSAAFSLAMLNGIYRYTNITDLNPKVTMPKQCLTLGNKENNWQQYRENWLLSMDNFDLSQENQIKKQITVTIAVSTVLTFTAGVILLSQAATPLLILSLAAYATSLLLSINSINAPLRDTCNKFPEAAEQGNQNLLAI